MHRVVYRRQHRRCPRSTAAAYTAVTVLAGVATYAYNVHTPTYLRGPSGILVMFAEELKKVNTYQDARARKPTRILQGCYVTLSPSAALGVLGVHWM